VSAAEGQLGPLLLACAGHRFCSCYPGDALGWVNLEAWENSSAEMGFGGQTLSWRL